MRSIEKQILSESINRIVREALNNLQKQYLNEAKKKTEKDDKIKTKRAVVLKWLRSKELNKAEIMRKLWHPSQEEEDAMRSEFSKKVRGKDADGKEYSFTTAEINKLYSIKSDSDV